MNVSTYSVAGIPEAVGVILFTLSLVIFLSPYLPSIKVGGVEISKLSIRQRRICIFIGPILLLASTILFFPVHYRHQAGSANSAKIYEFNGEGATGIFSGTIALVNDCTFSGFASRMPVSRGNFETNRDYVEKNINEFGALVGTIDGQEIGFKLMLDAPVEENWSFLYPISIRYEGIISQNGEKIRGGWVSGAELIFDISPPIDGC